MISLRICTRAAPLPSVRSTPSSRIADGSWRRGGGETFMRSLRSTGGFLARASALNGARRMPRQALLARLAALCALALLAFPAAAEPMRIVVFGDSLSAGLGLMAPQAFPARL